MLCGLPGPAVEAHAGGAQRRGGRKGEHAIHACMHAHVKEVAVEDVRRRGEMGPAGSCAGERWTRRPYVKDCDMARLELDTGGGNGLCRSQPPLARSHQSMLLTDQKIPPDGLQAR